MPSDCQCSTACACETRTVTKTVTKVLNDKEATRKIRLLEAEVKKLKERNKILGSQVGILESQVGRSKISKKKIISDLKKHLDNI